MADTAAAGEEVDNEINLEQLQLLKKIFEAADEDGSGELDINEFCAKLGPHLGVNLKPQEVAQLFMKIDADAGGTVDWDEFTNFMFLEKAQAAAGEGDSDNWRLFPADFRDKNSATSMHHEQVDKVYYCAAIDKYITCARDGSFRLWQGQDLDHVKTVNNGTSWITDCLYMPQSRKMVFTTMDRAITYYDIARGTYDLIGRVYASGGMGVPLTLGVLSGDAGERVVYGDSRGSAVLLLCGSRELPPRDLITTETHKDYIYLHKEHADWVTKIQWIPELGLVTSSLDATVKTFDINRERITHVCTHHTKGVHSFVWCHAYSCFASCGLERDVTVWHGTSGRKIGELRGHTSSVSHISLDPIHNHIFTLSVDKSIKVWDLRNHRCLQTITQDDWVRQSDSNPTCMMYDSARCRLMTACHRPYAWQHKVITQDRTGHKDPVRGALYNAVFSVIVSVDEASTTCLWNLQDGAREGRFNACSAVKAAALEDNPEDTCGPCSTSQNCVTAISFDKNQRRLVMATNSGTVTVWNFNNGSILRRFAHDQEPLEICEVLFAWDDKRSGDVVFAAGWNAKVFVWEDRDEDVVDSYKTLEEHRSDILAMAAYAPRQLLATGDYQGRIIIWGLFTGERKSWVTYSGKFAAGAAGFSASDMGGKKAKADLGLYSGCGLSTVECSVERLLWIPAYSPQQRQATAAAAAALTASAVTLAVSSSLACGLAAVNSAGVGGVGICMPEGQHAPGGPQYGAGSIQAVASSCSLLSDASLANMQAVQQQRHQQQQQQQSQHSSVVLNPTPPPAAAPQARPAGDSSSSMGGRSSGGNSPRSDGSPQQTDQPQTAAAAGAAEGGDEVEEPDALLLLASGGDGGVLVWHVDRLAQVSQLCELPGAVGTHEVVTATGLDEGAAVVVLGDSTGHLRVLDISAGIDTSSLQAAAASFKQRAHWSAHDGAIASLDLIPARSIKRSINSESKGSTPRSSSGSHVLILASSRDCNVTVWTLDGGLVGVLGEHSWDLDNPETWQDPTGAAKRPPKLPVQDDAEEGAEILGESTGAFNPSGSSSRHLGSIGHSPSRKDKPLAAALKSSLSTKGKAGAGSRVSLAGICGPKGSPPGSIPAHRRSPSRQQPGSSNQQLLQQQAAGLDGLSLASLVMQDRKQKQREAMVTTSLQPHCQLRVHQLADVNAAAGLCLKSAGAEAKTKQSQHKSHSVASSRHIGPGSRHLGSKPSSGSSWSGWTAS